MNEISVSLWESRLYILLSYKTGRQVTGDHEEFFQQRTTVGKDKSKAIESNLQIFYVD